MPPTNPHLTAAEFVPTTTDLGAHAEAAADCRGCDLWEHATEVVFGRGPANAWIVLVGE